jgi:hypothetical protein
MRVDKRRLLAALLLAVVLAPAAAFQTLAPAERRLLAPLASAWPGLDAETQQRLRANARHWLSLPPDQQQAMLQRMREWDELPPAERARRRGAYAAWEALSLGERERVRAAAVRVAALTPDQARALRDAFESLPSDQRQDWWLGPDIGADFARLRPLFAYTPENERPGLLALLRALSPDARNDLAVLARRLPSNERERLRHDLLQAAPESREALIRERLGQ